MVVEACSVTDKSRARLHQLVVDKSHQDGITKLVKTFNENKTNPDSLLFVQITHSGSVSDPKFSEVVRVCEPKGPDNTHGRILTKEDIKEIVGSFVDAAEVAYKAGANGVDVKCCHGYLLGQFLRPANTRDDGYGGSLEDRMRIVGEVIKGIRERVKDSKFKIMLRFSAYEGIQGGIGARTADEQPFKPDEIDRIDLSESIKMARKFVEWGVDMPDVTAGIPKFNGGVWVRPQKLPAGTIDNPLMFHHMRFAKAFKDAGLGVPIIASGFSAAGKDLPKLANAALRGGVADATGIGRQSLADPDFRRISQGTHTACTRCGRCSSLLVGQIPVGCGQHNKVYRMLSDTVRKIHLQPQPAMARLAVEPVKEQLPLAAEKQPVVETKPPQKPGDTAIRH